MIWILLIALIGYIAFRFFSDVGKDDVDLRNTALPEKFGILIDLINQAAFSGHGKIFSINRRSFNLYKDGQNQIICFFYSTGHLTITWKYKFYQKEIVHEEIFRDVRNLSIFEQQRIAEIIVTEMSQVIQRHQNSVLKDIYNG